METISPYARQYNNPDDLYRAQWNESQVGQQHYLSNLSGGSWSQPPWSGWHPIIGAGYGGFSKFGNSNFLQRYAQDGDSGFFFKRGIFGGAEPLGAHHLPLNTIDIPEIYTEPTAEPTYETPKTSTIEPPIVEPSPTPDDSELELKTQFEAEPQQRATHVPPYSRLLYTGMGQVQDETSALHEEPFKIPEYKGSFHKKGGRFK